MISTGGAGVLGNIAAASRIAGRVLARGPGWYVEDVVCTSGPHDKPFEERHSDLCISVVTSGTFQYRSPSGEEVLTPGSLLLGNAEECYECRHEHGTGDRCVAFHYSAECFGDLARNAGATPRTQRFRAPRLPPVRDLASLVAQCYAGLHGAIDVGWEELSVRLAARTLQLAGGIAPSPRAPASALARVTRAVRHIERQPASRHTLGGMARAAGLSPYHFLRTFERLTGVTPHQYVLRTRLREAARQLATESCRVIDVALDCGFGDVSNFNRAFRAEFAVAPLAYRARHRDSRFGIRDSAFKVAPPSPERSVGSR